MWRGICKTSINSVTVNGLGIIWVLIFTLETICEFNPLDDINQNFSQGMIASAVIANLSPTNAMCQSPCHIVNNRKRLILWSN